MLIALWENHHASGVALKVLATWAGAVNDSDPCANFYTHSKTRSSVTAKAPKKRRLSPLLSPRSRPRSTCVVAAVAGVATSLVLAPQQIGSDAENSLCSIEKAGNYPVKHRMTLIKFEIEGRPRSLREKASEPSDRRDQRSLDRRVWREKKCLKRQLMPQASKLVGRDAAASRRLSSVCCNRSKKPASNASCGSPGR